MMLQFNLRYFLLAVLLFITEVTIAFFFLFCIIRPHIGDLLVVILIYCFLKSFFNIPVFAAAIATLLFAYAVEILQALHIVEMLGLQHSRLAHIIIGTSFSWLDMVSYTVGIAIVLLVEKIADRKNKTSCIY